MCTIKYSSQVPEISRFVTTTGYYPETLDLHRQNTAINKEILA